LADVKLETNFVCSAVPSSAIKHRNRVCGFFGTTPGNHKETEIRNKIREINKYKRKHSHPPPRSRCCTAWEGSTGRSPPAALMGANDGALGVTGNKGT